MKKTTINLAYDDEKLAALRIYLDQKNTTIENELLTTLETLYTKYVPGNVREFIQFRQGALKTTEKKPRPSANTESDKPAPKRSDTD